MPYAESVGNLPDHLLYLLTSEDLAEWQAVLDRIPPDADTAEVGVWYGGGSTYLAACRARQHNRLHFALDEFGRPGAGIPSSSQALQIAFTHLVVEDLIRWVALVPGSTVQVGGVFATGAFGAVFIDGSHDAHWVRHDMTWARRVVTTGGFVSLHDLHGDHRYPGYEEAVEQCAAEWGWKCVGQQGSTRTYCIQA